jgi:sodium transport system permease protein
MLWTLIKKEFLDIVRDRRTLIMSLVIPILIFPVMMLVVSKIKASTEKTQKEKLVDVALIAGEGAEAFRQMLLRQGPLLTKKGSVKVREDLTLEEGRRLIEAGSLDALIYFDPEFQRLMDAQLPGRISIYFKRTTDSGRAEHRRLINLLERYEGRLYQERLSELGIDEATTLQPIEINEFNLASEKEVFAGLVGRLLPYMFIMFSIMGVMHPATDLAAGEKERGTLETLFTTPATRMQILFAKFLVVVSSGLASAVVTMGSLYIGVRLIDKGAGEINKVVETLLEPMTILAVLCLLIPVTVFFAAITLAISVYAKSFKEAQSFLGPLIMVSILPLVASFAPGLELSAKTALIPILNVSLSMKAIIGGTAEVGHLAIVYGSLAVFALFGLFMCSRMFSRESAVFRT